MKHPATMKWSTELPSLACIALSVIAAFYFYAHFPERVPIHWNMYGDVDGYAGKAFGAWFSPLLMIAIYLLFIGLPYIDPKKHHYAGFTKSYHGIKNTLMVFMLLITLFAGVAGLGYDIPIAGLVPIAVGILFVCLGYYIKNVEQNWAMGVRTPWTMESATVWRKTNHLMAGVMMVAGVMIAACAYPFSEIVKAVIFISAIALVIVVPIVYSYFAYRAEQKGKQ